MDIAVRLAASIAIAAMGTGCYASHLDLPEPCVEGEATLVVLDDRCQSMVVDPVEDVATGCAFGAMTPFRVVNLTDEDVVVRFFVLAPAPVDWQYAEFHSSSCTCFSATTSISEPGRSCDAGTTMGGRETLEWALDSSVPVRIEACPGPHEFPFLCE